MAGLLDITGVGQVAELAQSVVNRLWPDRSEQERAALAAELQIQLGQMQVNAAEAASGSPYAAGWRPTIGYVCAAALTWNFIVHPMLSWAASAFAPQMLVPPQIQSGLFELVLGMLGLGGLRTYEKIRGAAS